MSRERDKERKREIETEWDTCRKVEIRRYMEIYGERPGEIQRELDTERHRRQGDTEIHRQRDRETYW